MVLDLVQCLILREFGLNVSPPPRWPKSLVLAVEKRRYPRPSPACAKAEALGVSVPCGSMGHPSCPGNSRFCLQQERRMSWFFKTKNAVCLLPASSNREPIPPCPFLPSPTTAVSKSGCPPDDLQRQPDFPLMGGGESHCPHTSGVPPPRKTAYSQSEAALTSF